MIGAGGVSLSTGGATGGYIRGVVSFPSNTSTIKVKVGATGTPSGASYINIPTIGPLFVIAGAGGGATFGAGGEGGGGVFTSGVAPGGNAFCSNSGGSRISLTAGGLGYTIDFSLNCINELSYNGASYAGNFEESLGGVGPTGSGGSGYAGGGGGNSFQNGGGGSSYIDTGYTTVLTSYSGNNVPVGVLPGYGRGNQSGYIQITLLNYSVFVNQDISGRSLFYTNSIFISNRLNASTVTASSITTTSTLNTSTIQVSSLVSSAAGKILLGTGVPTYPMEINGGGVSTLFTTGYKYTNASSISTNGSSTDAISVKTDLGIWASIFYATSDQRIKKNIQSLEEEQALQVVRQIQPVTYQYIDQMNRHNEIEYGFIAQDVQSVLPYAIRSEPDFVPNVYDIADITAHTESTSLLTLRNTVLTDIEPTDIVKIFDFNQRPLTYHVLEKGVSSMVVEGKVMEDLSERRPEDVQNNIQENTVFVYGKKVPDLHILDKHAIFSVGVAAIKEIDQVLKEQQSTLLQQNKIMDELESSIKYRFRKNNV